MQRSRRSWLRTLSMFLGLTAFVGRVRGEWFWNRFRLDPIVPPPLNVTPVDNNNAQLDPAELDGPVVDLQEQLETGLMARRDEEFAFLRRVALMVQTGQLSEELVTSTFQWARDKRPYPLPYFKRALQVRAAKQGIKVR